jgi:hypothetical protein
MVSVRTFSVAAGLALVAFAFALDFAGSIALLVTLDRDATVVFFAVFAAAFLTFVFFAVFRVATFVANIRSQMNVVI